MQFFQFKIERMNRQQDMFCFNHASAFYTNNNNIVMLMNNKFMPQTLTGNPTGNLICHVLAPRALNMSCRCGQSARSIETGEYLIPHLGLTDQLWGVFGILKKKWLYYNGSAIKSTLRYDILHCEGIPFKRVPQPLYRLANNGLFSYRLANNSKSFIEYRISVCYRISNKCKILFSLWIHFHA